MFSLHKCKLIWREAISFYKKTQNTLPDEARTRLEKQITALDQAILSKDRLHANDYASELDSYLKTHGHKGMLRRCLEFVAVLACAICIAGIVRYTWFELYEIPTGSMRPTFKEQDRVIVSKDAYGINTPFQTSHLYFEPDLIQRGNIIVLSGDGIDLPDVDTKYFLLFPGKKRYVKRCMGKPGDTLYFYGGRIYGIDKHGQSFSTIHSPIEHIPFSTFEGKIDEKILRKDSEQQFTIKQMNMPLARVTFTPTTVSATLLEHNPANSYGALWGIKNYAECRLINPQDLPGEALEAGYTETAALLFLELKHSPTLITAEALQKWLERHNTASPICTHTTWIPLHEQELEALKSGLYTSRFIVKNGAAFRYGEGDAPTGPSIFLGSDVPDGVYEFFNGKAYSINSLSISKELAPSHPIYPKTPAALKTLFNSGIELSPFTNPGARGAASKRTFFPARYAYFRNGVLFTMNTPLLAENSPVLYRFHELEKERAIHSSNYVAFTDSGPPSEEQIRNFGLKIPEKNYLALGDNYANSADSRYFGFVPEKNIQGSPVCIFWPFGKRFGEPPQPSVPFFRLPNVIVLSIVAIIAIILKCYYSDTRYRRILSLPPSHAREQ